MAYASNADVEGRLGSRLYVQLTDDAGTGVADEAKVTEAREVSEGEVNSYVGRRYAVPVDVSGESELAAVLRGITLDLVEHRLHARRPPVPSDVGLRRTAANDWLRRAATGEVVLPSARELAANVVEGDRAVFSGPERVWGREEAEDL